MAQKRRKRLAELNLLDRFLFNEVMEDPGTYRDVLEMICGREILLKETVQSEKEIRTLPTFRGIRLDVWGQDEEGNIYNSEMQSVNTKNLPRRSRYYQSVLDAGLLEPGTVDFNRLRDVHLIMIAPFDLFGLKRCVYTFQMRCCEDPALCLQDGAVRMFLYTRGEDQDNVTKELRDFLRYVEHTDEETARCFQSPRLKRLHERVKAVKSNEGIEVKYMQLWEEKVMERLEGRSEGMSKGITKGEERVSRLNLLLIGQKRYDDLEKASRDREYREQLFKTFGL